MTTRATNAHITVLLEEGVDALNLKRDSVVVDATLGAGGHSKKIIAQLGPDGRLVSIDADASAVAQFGHETAANHTLAVKNFRDIRSVLDEHSIKQVDGILADLGWRQEQFVAGEKGFSFQYDEPLLMTYGDPSEYPFTARDIVNEWDESVIADILFGYGEERYARRIAKAICQARQQQAIETTFDLVALIEASVPTMYTRGKLHAATKSFQALRIAVNDELEALKTFLAESLSLLSPHGRLAVITFHSIEDRIVKNYFRDQARDQHGSVITKKPITPHKEEITENPRARSAKLRIFEKH